MYRSFIHVISVHSSHFKIRYMIKRPHFTRAFVNESLLKNILCFKLFHQLKLKSLFLFVVFCSFCIMQSYYASLILTTFCFAFPSFVLQTYSGFMVCGVHYGRNGLPQNPLSRKGLYPCAAAAVKSVRWWISYVLTKMSLVHSYMGVFKQTKFVAVVLQHLLR